MSFELKKLSEVTTKIGSGATPKGGKEAYYSTGIPFLRSQNVLDFQFSHNGLAFIDENQAHDLRNVTVEVNDVLLNITGDSVARCCMPDKNVVPARVNQHVAIIRTDPDLADSKFVMYALLNPLAKKSLLSLASHGGTRNALTKAMIENFEISLPQMEIQKKITSLLSTLDDKIDLNIRVNKVLEQMAQAIFKQWFVDFEFPNENGEPYKSSGGEMVWCEEIDKEIPPGWKIETIENVTSFVSRGIAPKYAVDSDRWVINQKCIRAGALTLSLARPHESKVSLEKIVQFGDILVNSTGTGTLGRVAQVYEHLVNFTVDSHVTIIRPNLENGIGFLGCMLKNMQSTFENAGTGSTGQTELGREVIKQMKVLIPDAKLIKSFSEIYHSFSEKMIRAQKENSNLSSLRDTLLPKLMSGEIDVSEIEL
ncbi:restriction endonuclease subunit S [Paenibacillus sp. NEAU-GSW1]|uniref:restriction endonuclease subunit S n=1 Tax=Paenibacillus sp. NEAU-GSW1 TaxID=2682486 RepID=UPI0012E1CF51|nr:restriction endonuclease subunit S [Paenibacillus sp. NEAU-GSW1]MUT67843.1 restriction endonuclease subunit S [Paenibacillus sp. NEAU-GSW1]